jgi:hypothetical protein
MHLITVFIVNKLFILIPNLIYSHDNSNQAKKFKSINFIIMN